VLADLLRARRLSFQGAVVAFGDWLIAIGLVVVEVSEDERQSLDDGTQALKHAMPPGSDLEAGSLFAQLHRSDIACRHASDSRAGLALQLRTRAGKILDHRSNHAGLRHSNADLFQ